MTAKRWIGLISTVVLAAAGGAAIATAVLIGPMHHRSVSQAGSNTAATRGTPSPSSQLSANTSPSPAADYTTTFPPQASFAGAAEFGIKAAEEKTGLAYSFGGCAAGQSCLSHAVETDGENATYVGLDATGYSGGTKCYVYINPDAVVHWQAFMIVCGSTPDFAPVYGQTEPVRVSGGCANVRQSPGLNAPIAGCLTNGTLVKITATPSFTDNKMWFGVASDRVTGMMSLEFLVAH